MPAKFSNRDGQAMAMVTTSLIFMFIVMGLSVDLGWSYYLKTRVRAAAVAGAMAAGNYAKNNNDSCSSTLLSKLTLSAFSTT